MKQHRVCPWWLGYFLAHPLRRRWQDPAPILAPHVREGMTAFEPGSGMGFFTLELARLVGPSGRVIATDIQPRMLEHLRRRLARAGLAERVDVRLVPPESIGPADLNGTVDFILLFAVLHEMPSPGAFFRQAAQYLKPGGRLLLAEPTGHVTTPQFETQLGYAADAGLHVVARPEVRWSHAALLEKG